MRSICFLPPPTVRFLFRLIPTALARTRTRARRALDSNWIRIGFGLFLDSNQDSFSDSDSGSILLRVFSLLYDEVKNGNLFAEIWLQPLDNSSGIGYNNQAFFGMQGKSPKNLSLGNVRAQAYLPRFQCPAILYGGVAHLGERLNGIQEVVGSIPIVSTK